MRTTQKKKYMYEQTFSFKTLMSSSVPLIITLFTEIHYDLQLAMKYASDSCEYHEVTNKAFQICNPINELLLCWKKEQKSYTSLSE